MWSLFNDDSILYDGKGIIVLKALYVGHIEGLMGFIIFSLRGYVF